MEIMGANAFLYGLSKEKIRKILLSNTVEEACNYVEDKNFFDYLANRIRYKMIEYSRKEGFDAEVLLFSFEQGTLGQSDGLDRKSTRLNSSHANISYAVFCLNKKKIIITSIRA